ncbi:MAG: hypothetical protein KF724_11305 [Phycisphaeraceae bacterium]|nr:hypothetical protein [Phycisphaeraceae bacterium]
MDPGHLLVLTLMTPVVGALLSFMSGDRGAARVAIGAAIVGLGISFATATVIVRSDAPLTCAVGGWQPPLGILLRADGLSAAMMVTASLIVLAVSIAVMGDSARKHGAHERRQARAFWLLSQGLAAALMAVFLCSDFFSLYVAIELLTFAAVPLVSLEGSSKTISAALRYLLFALLGSMAYLLGTALLYGSFGTLDLGLIAEAMSGGAPLPAPIALAVALMVAGLLAKTALVPLHLWLPAAHGGAPPSSSALLSSLVVKGSFFILVRLWFDALPSAPLTEGAILLGALGSLAILHGSVMALRQARLKMLIAYSTIAQIGYLFLVFPLAAPGAALAQHGDDLQSAALAGGMLQAISHAFAKAAMFLGAGVLAGLCGSDRLDALRGIAQRAPMTIFAMALAGFSLIGLPPSGGFWAKWRLLTASVESGQWWWAVVILIGGMLAVGYITRILTISLDRSAAPRPSRDRRVTLGEIVTLALALTSFLLGILAFTSIKVLFIGRPLIEAGVTP